MTFGFALSVLIACGGGGVEVTNSDTASDVTTTDESFSTSTATTGDITMDGPILGSGPTLDSGPILGSGPIPAPPFAGTIFLDPDIITADDPSAFESIAYDGIALKRMFDRRANAFISLDAHIFQALYDDGLSIELQVNTEFSKTEASTEADRYARLFGQLPTLLRRDVDTSWIHRGVKPWGGGNRNLLVHTGQAEFYFSSGIAEETLIHEACHTSLDANYAAAPGWIAAQQADVNFISTYARDYPTREDIAESFLPYMALRYRREAISDEYATTIENTIPNRIQFFDSIVKDMYPLE
ncbi:hypothetical protein AB833_05590 [Chromatiales bacterium (ex Bugula neritina AB1)]|nr:hypothetical protein AB833_05590 [Chromatiales bacterium (ex Bugula neritina AB1)]